MIKVSFLYPYRENGRFDVDYYCNTAHAVRGRASGRRGERLVRRCGVIASVAPGSPPPYVAVGHLLFESVEAFHKALRARRPGTA